MKSLVLAFFNSHCIILYWRYSQNYFCIRILMYLWYWKQMCNTNRFYKTYTFMYTLFSNQHLLLFHYFRASRIVYFVFRWEDTRPYSTYILPNRNKKIKEISVRFPQLLLHSFKNLFYFLLIFTKSRKIFNG